jgi:hypothetical protein
MRAAGALLVKGDDPASENGQRLEKAQNKLEQVRFCLTARSASLPSLGV